jgi:tetratricopeptide (TPR) repeat protein
VSARNKREITRGSTKIIVIITLLTIITVTAVIIHKGVQSKRNQEIQKSYSTCYQNLSLLEKALMEYKSKNDGKYPGQLKALVPKYIKAIPTCPQAGRDTYSSSYMGIDDPPLYFIYCEGKNHQGPPDTPQIISDLGFFPDRCDNPMTVVFENGQMKSIMKMLQESNQLMEKKRYDDAIVVLKKMLKLQKAKRQDIYYMIARAYWAKQEDSKAIEALDNAFGIKFDLVECLRMESFIFKQDNRAAVLKILENYNKKNPDDVSCVILMTKLLEDLGNRKEVKEIYEKALEKGTELSPVVTLYFEGQVQRLEGKNEEAMETLMAIREIPTRNQPAENYICTLSEEYIKHLRGSQETGK